MNEVPLILSLLEIFSSEKNAYNGSNWWVLLLENANIS